MRKKVNKKLIVALLSFVLLFGGTFGSSLAWLLDNTEDVTNTFSTSNIDIELYETKEEFQMVPGWAIDKDPKIKIIGGSEDCWVFVEVIKENDLDTYIEYAIDMENWTKLENAGTDSDGMAREVYYTKATDITKDRDKIKILGAGSADYTINGETIICNWEREQVLTKPTVTKEQMDAMKDTDEDDLPKLSFIAYATQLWKNGSEEFDVNTAWNLVKDRPAQTPATP